MRTHFFQNSCSKSENAFLVLLYNFLFPFTSVIDFRTAIKITLKYTK